MNETKRLRAIILQALGLPALVGAGACDPTLAVVGTDTDDTVDTDLVDTDVERTCEEAPRLESAEQGTGVFLVCTDETEGCDAWADNPYQFIIEAVGEYPDPFCGWGPTVVCGPEAAITDECCYVLDVSIWCEGRPFTIDGEARLPSVHGGAQRAPAGAESIRSRLAAEWLASARAEHASIASFARFVLDLLAFGAPADLVADATRAMGDEIEHARLAFAIASRFAGTTLRAGALDTSGAEAHTSLESALVAAFREGCVNETVAAAQAAIARDACEDPEIRAALSRIADDEARHAALAWRFVRWTLAQDPSLRDVLAREAQRVRIQRPEIAAPGAGRAWGRLGPAEMQSIAADVARDVVRPCTQAVLQA